MNYFLMQYILKKSKSNNNNYYNGTDDASLIFIPAALIASLIVMGGVFGYLKKQEKEKNQPSYGYEQNEDDVKTFEPGEHVISVLIDSPLDEAKQYEYHPGYKPLGISTSTYGKSEDYDAGSCMLYVNDLEVVAKADGEIDGQLHFGNFGIPIEYEEIEQSNDTYAVDFAKGTHILSVPINDPTEYNVQYDFHEGYEPIGIATAAYGQGEDNFSGGCILYVNSEDVTCKKEDNNEYTKFGTPIEKAKVKVKK